MKIGDVASVEYQKIQFCILGKGVWENKSDQVASLVPTMHYAYFVGDIEEF